MFSTFKWPNFREAYSLTNYRTFCENAADAGVEKWTVDTQKMTCTYYDKAGKVMLEEAIPLVTDKTQ